MTTKILIVGLGQIGTANLTYLQSLNNPKLDIYCYDPKYKNEGFGYCSNLENFKDADIYMVNVSTHNPDNPYQPNLKAIEETMHRIETEGKAGSLVCLESTVPPGTCSLFAPALKKQDIHLVHVPERFYGPEQNTGHGINQMRVLGYCCGEGLGLGLRFYQLVLKIPLHVVPSMKIAEASKIVENANRYVKIALVEEHYLWATKLGIDPDLLLDAVNTKWNSDGLLPIKGIKGHCLPKDTLMYIDEGVSGTTSIAKAAMLANKNYEAYLQAPKS